MCADVFTAITTFVDVEKGRATLKRHSVGFTIGIILTLVLGFGYLAVAWLSLSSVKALGYYPTVLKATKTGPNSASLELSTWPDSQVCHQDATHPEIDWVTYCPSTVFEVPPDSIITVTIKNYDGETELHNTYFQQIQGTLDGTETLTGNIDVADSNGNYQSQAVTDQSLSKVDPSIVSHTFTLQSREGTDTPFFLSIPVIGVPDSVPVDPNTGYPTTPNVITFQFKSGPAGTVYIFRCYDPCGNGLKENDNDPNSVADSQQGFAGPMATLGYMTGSMTVANY